MLSVATAAVLPVYSVSMHALQPLPALLALSNPTAIATSTAAACALELLDESLGVALLVQVAGRHAHRSRMLGALGQRLASRYYAIIL